MLLTRMLDRLIRTGSLTMIDADGRQHRFGDGTLPKVTIRLHDRKLHTSMAINPSLATGEAYMDGDLTIEEGTLTQFLDLATRSFDNLYESPMRRVARLLGLGVRLFQQYNPIGKSRQNVAHHYDLSGALYDLFLDRDRQYSCAYFAKPDDSLEAAQHNKKVHIAAKLLLDKPDLKVLDIGCGWGGMALYLAQAAYADVTGITLSTEQAKVAAERAAAAGLDQSVRFKLQDYRLEQAQYDRIVSVGMFEHVGVPQFPTFFRKMRELLKPDGVALLHAIGRMDGPGITDPWIRKYIFPGGYVPALSEVLPVIEKAGLWVTDIEILRLHYAETLKAWLENFTANREQVARIYDERFCRMWEFYLVGCEMAFRHLKQMVFQIQITREQSAAPLTRDYIVDWERAQLAKLRSAAAE
ncbi:MAG TPA: cyclopropane-fatty-acyl-phospholipid synthase family protein [Alphaproteobacteria bacterium]|nr:cyclopropane-fatty-acyl-phospholipid synthase family protein [Alphaproteobacteria bacterium]